MKLPRGEHHVTIPAHAELRLGTLSAILGDVADHFDDDRVRRITPLVATA